MTKVAGSRAFHGALRAQIDAAWEDHIAGKRASHSASLLYGYAPADATDLRGTPWVPSVPVPVAQMQRPVCGCGQTLLRSFPDWPGMCGDCAAVVEKYGDHLGDMDRLEEPADPDPTSNWAAWAHPNSEGP